MLEESVWNFLQLRADEGVWNFLQVHACWRGAPGTSCRCIEDWYCNTMYA